MGSNKIFKSNLEKIYKINYPYRMKSLKFKYLTAKNFLCFGPKGIELKFDDYGSIVFIRGENRDVKKTEESPPCDEVKISSNGSGKSSIQEIISYGLYGKTIKKPSAITKDGVINNLVGKNCMVELQWGNYRIVRCRKKNSLQFWESESQEWNDTTEITTGSMDETQVLIEDSIGLSYEAFVNICIFTDDQSSSFLEANAALKREIVENLLALSSYREKQERAKKFVSETTANIKMLTREYDILRTNEDQSKRRLQQAEQKESEWKRSKKSEVDNLQKSLDDKKERLGKTSHGAELLAYQDAQKTIQESSKIIDELDKSIEDEQGKIKLAKEKEEKIREVALELRSKGEEIKLAVNTHRRFIENKKQHIASLGSNEHGSTCDHCYGVIDSKNIKRVIDEDQKEINEANRELSVLVASVGELSTKMQDISDKQNKIKEFISTKESLSSSHITNIKLERNKISVAMKVKEPKADSYELLMEQEISQIRDSITAKNEELNGKSPFEDIIVSEKEFVKTNEESCQEKSKSIKESEDNLKYYQYWQAGFGEKGIRKIVVDGIIPQLNNRIAYWLQFLIDNKLTLKFDNEFNETIERNPQNGDPYIYHAMSAGQRRRLNLAVSQAFADIMMISCGTIPSIVFLDEVTTNIDPLGVQGIYNMIQELSQEKQVFITTHDKDLIKMLETADTINLIHEDGFTILNK